MGTDVLATRLAMRLRLPIAAVGVGSLFLAVANLFLDAVDDRLIGIAAMVVGAAAAAMFLVCVSDQRFQRAVSALNARRRTQAREKGRSSRLPGWELLPGDRLLVTVNVPLLVMTLIAANSIHRLPATLLLIAAFALGGMAQIALLVRGQPTDRWFDPFA
jgi:hypothetical protein